MRVHVQLYCAGALSALAAPLLARPVSIAMLLAAATCLGAPRARLLGAFVLGFAWTGLAAERAWHALLPRALEDTAIAVAGRVASFPLSSPGMLEFELAQVRARGLHTAGIPARIAVRAHIRLPPPALGAWCELKVRLRRPRGLSNPGGHDRVRLALARGIGATAVVVAHPGNLCMSLAAPPVLDGIRATLAQRIADAVSEPHAGAVLRALTVDDRSALTATQWERMRRTGTAHLLAISGLQISLCAGLAFSLCRIACALVCRGRQTAWPLRVAWYGALGAALAYTAIGGAGVPLMRATLMLACAVAATLAGMRVCSWRTWWLSLAAVLTWQPLDALNAGMWLSFAAVGVLIALATPAMHPLRAAWRTHLALCIALAPLTALVFGSVAWVAPLANLVAVPWCNVLVVPLALAGLALYLATVKRRQEMNWVNGTGRRVLAQYTTALLDRFAILAATGALIFYSLFVMASRPALVATIPLVLFGLFRYAWLVDVRGVGESPAESLFTDWQLAATVVSWAGLCAWVLLRGAQ